MSFLSACKAFFKAWNDPEAAKQFLKEDAPQISASDLSHLKLLSLLQQSGRLIDFLKENISGYSDAEVGAAVRQIHADCAKSLEEYVTIRPLFQEAEGDKVVVPQGYDPQAIKLVGAVKGEPPFQGTLVHRGWKAHKRSLPKKIVETSDVIQPAEIEIR